MKDQISQPMSTAKRLLLRDRVKSLAAAAKRRGVKVEKLSDYHFRLTPPDGASPAEYWPTTQRVFFHGAYFDGIEPTDLIATLCSTPPTTGAEK